MADDSMPMPDNGKNVIQTGYELPVQLDTLEIGGERPEVGDDAEAKVKGRITRIVDDCAYISVETANDNPIEDKSDDGSDERDLAGATQRADAMGMPIGGTGGY
jgi:hypothetical protein